MALLTSCTVNRLLTMPSRCQFFGSARAPLLRRLNIPEVLRNSRLAAGFMRSAFKFNFHKHKEHLINRCRLLYVFRVDRLGTDCIQGIVNTPNISHRKWCL